jgi:glycerate kinase
MMRILIAPDKFKDSLSAQQVCSAICEGLLKKNPELIITGIPLADGGEGTAELLTAYFGGTMVQAAVNDPLFTPIMSRYGISKNGTAAFIEMAEASGLHLLDSAHRNPMHTTTFGTGQLIADALGRGVDNIVLGIGGSATNDAGIGMAAALGYEFLDYHGNKLQPVGSALAQLHTIRERALHSRLRQVTFTTLCDVSNPLYGPDGAAFVYGPQKGASPEEVIALDGGLRNFERVVQDTYPVEVNFPGAGAAGGLGAGARVFLHATLTKGMEYMLHATKLEEKIEQTDVVITGEGKLDSQSFSGKVVGEVSALARRKGKSVIVVCGQSDLSDSELGQRGIDRVVALASPAITVTEAKRNAFRMIADQLSKLDLNR